MTLTALLLGALASAAQTPPYEVLPVEAGLKSLAVQLQGKDHGVWLEGDVLHFAAKGKEPMQVTGGIQMPLQRVPETDLWIARLKMKGWDSALVGYAFLGPEFKPGIRFSFWRGDHAPPEPKRVVNPHRLETIELESKALGEKRSVTVYLPPGATKDIPAVVMADGVGARQWAMALEALILDGKVRPTAIVGIHSGSYRGDRSKEFDPKLDFRAREYLKAMDAERFAAHLRWVTDEVLPELSKRFGISQRRQDLAVAGFSNGGAFAVTAAVTANRTFGAAIPLSVGIPTLGEKPDGPMPRFFFAAGKLEPGFLKGTSQAHETVKEWGAESEMETFVAGHDSLMWEIAFAKFVSKVFPAEPRTERSFIHRPRVAGRSVLIQSTPSLQ